LQKNKGLSFMVFAVLIMNFVLLSKVGNISNQIQNVSNNYNNIQSRLQSVSSDVNHNLDQFTREQSWITPVGINAEKSKVDNAQSLVVADWQIKDFQQDSEVIFHYRSSDAEAFKSITALSQNTGFFEVQIPIEIEVGPFWEVHVSGEREASEMEEIKEMEIKKFDQNLMCYVSMETKDSIKSSEISSMNIGYLSHIKYKPVIAHVNIRGKQHSITLFEEKAVNDNDFESIQVEFYNGDTLLAEKPLEVISEQNQQNRTAEYALSYDAGSESVSHIILEVKYKSGDTFRKEIR